MVAVSFCAVVAVTAVVVVAAVVSVVVVGGKVGVDDDVVDVGSGRVVADEEDVGVSEVVVVGVCDGVAELAKDPTISTTIAVSTPETTARAALRLPLTPALPVGSDRS